MENVNRNELEDALAEIESMISRSERVKHRFKEGSPQLSLANNRIKALDIAKNLITEKLRHDAISDYTGEELKSAVPPIVSTISKCEKRC